MGLFSKPTTYLPRREKYHVVDLRPGGGTPSSPTPTDSGASSFKVLDTSAEQIRAQLSKLFAGDEGAGVEHDRDASESQGGAGGAGSAGAEGRKECDAASDSCPLPSQSHSKRERSEGAKSRSSGRGSASSIAGRPLMPLSSGISSLENVMSATEELTPISAISPGQFPDAGKAAPSAFGNDLTRRAVQSPGKGSPRVSASGSSFGHRLSMAGRTNSISRLARRASTKRKSSSKEHHDDVPVEVPPLPAAAATDRDTKTRAKPIPGLSSSPTTPHEVKDATASRLDLDDIPIVTIEEIDEYVDAAVPAPVPSQHAPKPEVAAAQEHAHFVRPFSASPSLEVISDEAIEAAVERLSSKDWGGLDACDDFADVYGLEAATARDFVAVADTEGDDRLNNSPSSPDQLGLPFGRNSSGSASTDGNDSSSQFPPAQGGHADVPVRRQDGAAGEVPSGEPPPKPKSKGKARKRPPALLTPEPPSGNSPASSSPNTGVFGSNGDFATGGFRITSEGMVGKPQRVTRRDSDDAPSYGHAPQSPNDLVLVRSLGELRKGPTLGMGAAGRVYLAIHEPSGASMAIKVVNVYDEAKRNQLLKELDTLSSHVSRFLVRFYGAFYDGKGAVHIALEFMDGGCLSSTVQKFGAIPEPITKMITADCLRALRFLHRHNVLHRDFKTANILLSRRTLCARVSDFGLARDMDAGVSKVDTFVGTIAYMSPERLHGGQYTYASDVWALGISVVECLLGRYPFDKPQSYFDYLDVQANDMLRGARISPAAADFVRLCTNSDPRRRPTAAQLMQHPWISDLKRDPEMFRLWMDDMHQRKSMEAQSMRSMQSIGSFLAGK
jgi:hypothetical protein